MLNKQQTMQQLAIQVKCHKNEEKDIQEGTSFDKLKLSDTAQITLKTTDSEL